MISRNLLLFISLWSFSFINAQNPGDHIFNNTTIHEIRISFEEADFYTILQENYAIGEMGTAKHIYLMADVTLDGENIDSVGVRFKGFTSYTNDGKKKPIKLDFNEFVKGQRYDGLRKLNLNNATGDPSMQRDVICYDLLRESGVAAPRTSYSVVYINDEYWGFYQTIEQVDKTFIKQNFANRGGNLFKNKGWNNFEYKGAVDSLYHPPYQLKTNKTANDWSGLIHLMQVLNDTMNADFATDISEIFDVDLYLKTLAVDVATMNWDSNLQHGRNWYMYEDTVTGIFNWIPWDYNYALSSVYGGGSSNKCIIFANFSYTNIDSVTVGFSDFSFSNGEHENLWNFGDSQSSTEKNPTHTYASPGEYEVCLTVTVNDTCYDQICETIKTVAEVCPVIENGTCPHPANETFNIVVSFNPFCCNEWTEDCEQQYQEIYDFFGGSNGGGGGGGSDFSINQSENKRTLIKRLLDIPEFNTRYHNYFCDLLAFNMTEDRMFDIIDQNKNLILDEVKKDPNFLFSYDVFLDDIGESSDTIGLKYLLSSRIAELKHEIDSLGYCITNPAVNIPWHQIVINEFVASNDSLSGISDPSGKYEDWIEIYNNMDTELNLTDIYLSDKKDKLKDWKFPDNTIIPANGYIIVWADKDEEEEGFHAGFKLKKSGESMYLSNKDGSFIDSLSYEEQETNIASARRPNGTGDFTTQESTFGFNNNQVGTSDIIEELSINLYPNPVSKQLEVSLSDIANDTYQVNIYNVVGSQISTFEISNTSFNIDVTNYSNGLYLLQLLDKNEKFIVRKFIVKH